MKSTININKIFEQVAELDDHSKFFLLNGILDMLDKSGGKKTHCISDLMGSGKDIWKNIKIEY